MPPDEKEQRLKALQRRFRSVGARQDMVAGLRRRAREPKVWVLAFLCAAALAALIVGLS